MPTEKEIEKIIFGGGLTPDIKANKVEDFADTNELESRFGVTTADENEEESLNEEVDEDLVEEEEQEQEIPQPKRKTKGENSQVLELLMEQNKLLQQQLISKNSQNVNEVDQRALETGKAILNLQSQNPVLYNKLNNFISSELGGTPSNNQVNEKLNAVKGILKGDKFKDIDPEIFNEIVGAFELTENTNKSERNQMVQVINQLQKQVNALTEHKETFAKQTEKEKENQILLQLSQAEKEFGVKLERGSEEAEDFVLLVRNGKNPRTAFMKSMGLKETDKKRKGQTKEVDMNPPTSKQITKGGVPNVQKKLADKMFGNLREGNYASVFKP